MGPTHAASGDPSLGQDLEGRPRGSRMSSNARNETGVPSLERVFRGSFCRGVQKKEKERKKRRRKNRSIDIMRRPRPAGKKREEWPLWLSSFGWGTRQDEEQEAARNARMRSDTDLVWTGIINGAWDSFSVFFFAGLFMRLRTPIKIFIFQISVVVFFFSNQRNTKVILL